MAAGDIRAGRAFVQITVNDRKLVAGLKKARARLNAFSSNILGVGARLIGLATGLAAPFIAAATGFAIMGDEVGKMARRTGLAVETVSELAFAASQSGTDIKTLEKGIRGMQRGLLDAARGLSTATDNLEDLGLELKDFEGLDAEQQFKIFADRLAGVEDQGKRAALAMKIFGKSGAELLPLFEQGSKGIEAFQKEARELGIVFTKEDVVAAEAFTDTLDRMGKTFKAIVFQIGAAVAPLFEKLSKQITKTIKPLIQFIKANREVLVTALKFIGILAGLGVALIVVAIAIKVIAFALGAFALVISTVVGILALAKIAFLALFTPIGIIIAVIAGATAAFLIFTEAGQKVIKFFADRFSTLGAITRKAMNGVMDALRGGNILLAAKILWTGLKLIWFTGTQELQTIFFILKNSLTKIVINLSASIQKIFANMWAGIQSLFQKGKSSINDVILGAQQLAASTKFKLGLIDEKEFGEITNRLINQMGEFKDQQKRDLDEIDKQRKKSLEKIKEAREAGLTGADIIKDAEIKGIADIIARLTNELAKSTQKAKDLNVEAGEVKIQIEKGADGQDRFNDILKEISKRRKEVAGGGAIQGKTSGTFSSQAVKTLAIGGAKVQEKILDANKQTAKNTGKLLQMGGLNFS